MVCLGNACRSPIAEGVLRVRLERAGLGDAVLVDSAGTRALAPGAAPDPRAVRSAARRGIDLSRLRARTLALQDFERFDLLLAMDLDNLGELRAHCPDGREQRVRLLMEFAEQQDLPREVPDPYYGGPAGFDQVLDLIEAGCDGLTADLARRLALP